MEILHAPWAWYVAAPLITLCMYLLYFFGKKFGVSSNFETFCSLSGAGRFQSFFRFDWRKNVWNLVFVLGLIVGGFFADRFMTPDQSVTINSETKADLNELGIKQPGATYMPQEIFGMETLYSAKGLAVLLLSGILIGFGSRYARGCTAGHAIVGLSSLSFESLLAVVGFFVGGLLMNWFLLPLLIQWVH